MSASDLSLKGQTQSHEMDWRSCPRFPDFEISEWGDLRRIVATRNRAIGNRPRGFIDADGYLRYAIIDAEGNNIQVTAYRLVAEAFIGPPASPTHEVAHNNGSRTCAYFRELRWATRGENHADIQVHGTSPARGERNPKAKVSAEDVRTIRREYRAIKNSCGSRRVDELERKYGLHRSTVISIARGKSWSHIPLEPT